MGNPGVRLLVPSARVRDVRTMGEGKHARFSLHSGVPPGARGRLRALRRSASGRTIRSTSRCGSRSTTGTARSSRRWCCARSTRATAEAKALEAAEWWQRFEAELARDPAAAAELDPAVGGDFQRQACVSANAPAAVVSELASCGGEVLASAADAGLRAGMAREGARVADYAELERDPELVAGLRPRRPRRPAAEPSSSWRLSRAAQSRVATCTASGARPSGASRSAPRRRSWPSVRP